MGEMDGDAAAVRLVGAVLFAQIQKKARDALNGLAKAELQNMILKNSHFPENRVVNPLVQLPVIADCFNDFRRSDAVNERVHNGDGGVGVRIFHNAGNFTDAAAGFRDIELFFNSLDIKGGNPDPSGLDDAGEGRRVI